MDQNAGAAIFGSLSQMLAPHNMIRTLEGAERLNQQKRQRDAMDEGIKDLNFRATKDPALKKRINSAKAMFPNALASPEEFARFSSHLQEGQMAEEMVDELEQNGLLGSSGLADFYRKQATLNPSNAIRDMHSFVQGQEAFALRNAKEQEAKALAEKTALQVDADSMEMGRRIFEEVTTGVSDQMLAISKLPPKYQAGALKHLMRMGQEVGQEEAAVAKAKEIKAKEEEEKKKEALALQKESDKLKVVKAALESLKFSNDELVDEQSALVAIQNDDAQMEKLQKSGIKQEEIAGFISRRNQQLSKDQADREVSKAITSQLLTDFSNAGKVKERRGQVVFESENFNNALEVQGTALQGTLPDLGGEGRTGVDSIFGAEAGTPSVTRRLLVQQPEGYYNTIEATIGGSPAYFGFGFDPELGQPHIVQFEYDEDSRELIRALARDKDTGEVLIDEATGEAQQLPPLTKAEFEDTVQSIVMRGVQEESPDVSMAKAISKMNAYMRKKKGSKDLTTPEGALAQEVSQLNKLAQSYTEVTRGNQRVKPSLGKRSGSEFARTTKRDDKISSAELRDATRLASQYFILLQKIEAMERGTSVNLSGE